MRSLRLVGIALLTAVASMAALAAPSHAKDRNHDRIPDRWERSHHLSLRVNQARRDQDHDGLKNRGEFRAQTDPRDADSDDNGIQDGQEHAGTVGTISGEMVTINLFGGGSVTGKVTPQTEVECDTGGDDNGDGTGDHGDSNERSLRADDEGGDDGHGDNHGDGDNEGDTQSCPAGALKEGAVVQEAELDLTSAGAVFEKIDLVG
jgi:hypothetical protein